MGFGLRTLAKVEEGKTLINMKTSMGMVSDDITDRTGDAEIDNAEQDLHQQLMLNTRRVADHLSHGSVELSNKLNNHLILT